MNGYSINLIDMNFLLNLTKMVITFVTNDNLIDCAKNLDDRRLGKQRVEAKQLIDLLIKKQNGETKIAWENHPAALMWIGHIDALKIYYNYMVREWISRGFINNMELYSINEEHTLIRSYIDNTGKTHLLPTENKGVVFPWWFIWMPFVCSHRAALIRKDTSYFTKFKDNNIEYFLKRGYVWPDRIKSDIYSESIYEVIGTGAPAVYRFPGNLLLKWNIDRTKNPLTNRLIKETANTYQDYKKGYDEYQNILNLLHKYPEFEYQYMSLPYDENYQYYLSKYPYLDYDELIKLYVYKVIFN